VAAAVIVAVLVWSSNLPDTSDNHPSPEQIAKKEDEIVGDLTQDWSDSLEKLRDTRAMLVEQAYSDDSPDDALNDVFMRGS
jgi:hypothetical protein